jgi:hypothetical protein
MRRLPILALATLTALCAAACGPTVHTVRGARGMPGLDGSIAVEDAPGTNRMITVELEHAPPPGRVVEGTAHYAVWFRRPDRRSTFAGHMEYDPEDRRAELVATTPLHGFEILVTLERQEHPDSPSPEIVIRRRID